MNIAFCSTGKDRNSPLDLRFGRAAFYAILNTENDTFKVVDNAAKDAQGGAGPQAIQILVDNNVDVIIAPEFGPKAFDAMNQMGIKGFLQGNVVSIDEAYAAYKAGTLEKVKAAGNSGLHKA